MIIYMDLDGVLCDLVAGLRPFHSFDLETWPLGEYDLHKSLNLTEEVWDKCNEKWWSELPKTKDADTIMNFAVSLKPKRIHILTQTPPRNKQSCVIGKKNWIKKHYSDLHYSIISDVNKDCWASVDTLLIDDSDKNVNGFLKAGGMTFLIPRVWNSQHFHRSLLKDKDLKVGLYMNKKIVFVEHNADTVMAQFIESGSSWYEIKKEELQYGID